MKKKTEPLRGICKYCTRAKTCKEKNPVDDLGRDLRTIYCKYFRGSNGAQGRMISIQNPENWRGDKCEEQENI